MDTGSLIIGGKYLEEDDNSPIDVSGTSSTTYSVAGDYPTVIVVPQVGAGFDQLQVEGDSGSNYTSTSNADNQTTGQSQWPIPYQQGLEYFILKDQAGKIRCGVSLADSSTRSMIGGVNGDGTIAGSNINQFTLFDSGGSNRSLTATVYGRKL